MRAVHRLYEYIFSHARMFDSIYVGVLHACMHAIDVYEDELHVLYIRNIYIKYILYIIILYTHACNKLHMHVSS